MSDRGRGWLVVVWLGILPWTTWILLLSPHANDAVVRTPLWLFVGLGILLAASWIASRDAWLGCCMAYLALRALPAPYAMSMEHAMLGTIGAAILLASQSVPPADSRRWLILLAIGQLLYISFQHVGIDPIWAWGEYRPMRLLGTLGQENFVGVVLGMIGPLFPAWGTLAIFGGLFLVHNLTGTAACVCGWLRRAGVSWPVLLTVGSLSLLLVEHWPAVSLQVRQRVWQTAVQDQTWWTVLVGHGWGAWSSRLMWLHPQAGVGEYFAQAHNEWLQAYYEGGLAALVLVGGWVWSHRAAWQGPWGGAALAVGVTGLGFFTFHATIPAVVALVILGGAIRASREISN